MKNTINFTPGFITSVKVEQKRLELYDSTERGLGIRVSAKGSKSFFYRYTFAGKSRRYTIGTFPGVSIKEARQRARAVKVSIAQGIDPQQLKFEARRHKDQLLIRDVAEKYLARHIPSLRPSTQKEYKRIVDREIIPALGKNPADEVSRRDIMELLDKIAVDRGSKTMSNRVKAVLSSMFSFGVDRDLVQSNPVSGIKWKEKEVKRDRYYSEEEIKALWNAFEQQDEPVQSVYKLLLMLGQRSGETRRMRWEDISPENTFWNIPSSETKSGRSHQVPLTNQAVQIVERLKVISGDSDFVFASPKGGNRPVEHLQKATARIKEASGIRDFRVHDLRRTMASHVARLGADRTVVGKLLNHRGLSGDNQVTAIYDRYAYLDEQQKALEKWHEFLINSIVYSQSIK